MSGQGAGFSCFQWQKKLIKKKYLEKKYLVGSVKISRKIFTPAKLFFSSIEEVWSNDLYQ